MPGGEFAVLLGHEVLYKLLLLEIYPNLEMLVLASVASATQFN